MKTYRTLNFELDAPSAVVLGCFDGVHIGHSALLDDAAKISQKLNLKIAVFSFSTPPKRFFGGSASLLTTHSEKRIIMKESNVNAFISISFGKAVAQMSAERFFEEIVIGKMKARAVICGFNYRFGKGGVGDTALLSELCAKHGIHLCVVPPVLCEGVTVSSSYIREQLRIGELKVANEMLGRSYFMLARVVDGKRLARKLGFPTVNMEIKKDKALPPYGVYLSRISFDAKSYYGISNVGTRPTTDDALPVCETNIFDFDGDLYGKLLKVEFVEFIRSERKFGSVDELRAQVECDIDIAKELIKSL